MGSARGVDLHPLGKVESRTPDPFSNGFQPILIDGSVGKFENLI
jgi:hypothetical protein